MRKSLSILISILMLSTVFVSNYEAEEIDTLELPSFFSWQNIDGIDYTTPIKDQSPAPTCEAYALCASLETMMQYNEGELFNPDLSETHLYFYAGGTYEMGYVNLMDAADYLIEYGVPDEGCYPDPHRAFDYPFESLEGWENRTVKIQEWGWVDQEVSEIKNALIEHGPLVICTYVWKDFFHYKGGVYKHRWGRLEGGHVMTIIGYDDNDACWIVKNSWGSGWGDNGWLKIAYDADMFADWYGAGTGVMYIEGIYDNLKPDVPKVQFENLNNFHTYIFGREISTFFKRLPVQKAAPRIIGKYMIEVNAENTNKVEFYIDDEKVHTDDELPFTWDLQTSRGLHTLEVRAYNDHFISLDIIDIYVFM